MSRSLGSLTLDLIAKTANFTGPMDKASANYKRNANEINKSSELIKRGVLAAGAVLASALSVGALTAYADGWTDMQSRVIATTGSQQAATETMRELFGVARNTYSAFAQTNEIFLANSKTMEEWGYNTQKQVDFAGALNNALVAGGTKGQAAASVVDALSKALATGKLSGDQFNTVISSGGRVAQALADSLGVTTIELRKMASDGLLTATKVIDGMISQYPVVAAEAAKMPATVSDGFLLINNSASLLIGTLDQSIMTTGALADVLVGIADGMSSFALSLDAVDIVTGIELIKDAAIVLAGVLGGRLVGAAAEAAASFVIKTTATVQAAQATANAAAAEIAYARVVQLSLVAQLAAAKTGLEKAAIRKQLAANTAVLTAETTRYNAAVIAGSASAKAASIGVNLYRTALAAVGGPMGALVVAGAAVYMLTTRLDENGRALKAIEGPLDQAINAYREMGDEARRAAITGLKDESGELEKELRDLEAKLAGRSTAMNTWGQAYATTIVLSEKAQADLRLEIEKTNDKLELNRQKFAALEEVAPRSILRTADAIDKLIERNDLFGFSTKTIVDGAVSDYEKLNQQMLKRIALYGNESQAAELLYDIQNGLIKLNPGQDVWLLASAKRLDALTAETKAAKETADAYKQLKGDFQGIADRLDPGTAALNRFNKEQGILFNALDKGIIDLQRFDDLMKSLNGEFADSLLIDVDAIGSGLKGVEDIYTGMFERISGAGADVFVNWMTGAEDALSGLKDLAIRTIAEIANEALLTPIVLNVQQSMTGKPVEGASGGGIGSAIGAMGMGGIYAAAAVVAVSAIDSWNKDQDKKFAEMTAEFRQGNQSTGTLLGLANAKSDSIANVLGDMDSKYSDVLSVNYGMYQALVDIRAGIAGVASGFARSFSYSGALDGVKLGNSLGGSDLEKFRRQQHQLTALASDPWGAANSKLFEGNFLGEIAGFTGGFLTGIMEKVSKNIYRESRKIKDSGIQIVGASLADILSSGTIEAFSYADIETKKKVMGITASTKLKTTTESMGDLFQSQLAGVFENAADALKISSTTYGIDFDSLLGRLVIDPMKLSLKDLEGDAIAKEIEHFLSSTMDGWAQTSLAGTDVLERYQQVGEGAFETMVRLSTQTEQFRQQLGFVGLELDLTGVSAVKAAQDIAGYAGGFDTLSGSLSVYYDKFFTDAEKFENLTAQLAGATGGILDSLPETTAQFREIIAAIDNTTEAGQKQFAALINLSGPMYEYIKGLEDQRSALADFMTGYEDQIANFALSEFEQQMRSLGLAFDEAITKAQSLGASEQQLSAIRAASQIDVVRLLSTQTDNAMSRLNDSIASQITSIQSDAAARIAALQSDANARVSGANSWMQSQLNHYQRQISLVGESINQLNGLSDAIKSAIDAINPVTEISRLTNYNSAVDRLSALTSTALAGGGLPTADIINSLSGAMQGNSQYYSSYEDWIVATAGITANLDALAGVTETQLTADEKMLASLEASMSQAERHNSAVVGSINSGIESQIAAINAQMEADIAAMEKQRTEAEEQIAAMRGIDTSVLSVEEAVKQLSAAMQSESQNRLQQEAQMNAELLQELRNMNRSNGALANQVERLEIHLRNAS